MVTPANVKSVCLTGGIGSGKSTVALMLVAHGAHLVDTDAIARQLTTPGGAAMPQLAQLFGPGAVDASGALDREHMRQLVFSDASAKARLEAVLHPLIGQHAQQHAARAAAGQPVVFDVPLLHAAAPGCWWWTVKRLRSWPAWPSAPAGRVTRRSVCWRNSCRASSAAPWPTQYCSTRA
jgi:dephospho-CoA kinase